MTIEKQRIAIAKACGWKFEMYIDQHEGGSGRMRWKSPEGAWRGSMFEVGTSENLPDYLNDLNDMHEAEKLLRSTGMWQDYAGNICEGDERWETYEYIQIIMNATASQRAESFLKVLGLWEPKDIK